MLECSLRHFFEIFPELAIRFQVHKFLDLEEGASVGLSHADLEPILQRRAMAHTLSLETFSERKDS